MAMRLPSRSGASTSCVAARRTARPAAVFPCASPTHRQRRETLCLAAERDTAEAQEAGSGGSSDAAADTSSGTRAPSAAAAAAVVPSVGPPYGVMAALAALGTAETAYLTVAKLTASDVACPVAGACASVLNSSYATLLGLPLPLFGAAAYGAVAALAAAGAREAAAGRDLGPAPRLALAGGVGALAATSAYLMYVLQTSLGGAPCAWCYASAALSFSLAALLVVGLPARQLADAAGPGLASTAAAALLLYFGFAPVEGSTAAGGATFELPYNKPEVTKESTPRSVALAERLRDSGAQMFGAFWCSHCFEQEQTFGKQAMAALQNSASPVTVSLLAAAFPYVECFPDGWRRGVQLAPACAEVPVQAFPTWVIGNQIIEGELDFDTITSLLDEADKPAAAAVAAVEQ
ncbi:hypothetical protein MNEG_14991 [Monoraphidium neglectum]|uniref:Vitamin K epoxide reductase domain-containing protein n=1 Tax=Monoraphidium neglectum TaxID=145388 RepID=A0A0D2IYI1_9CHLO|nr:hypothetical protein MNEG_14991 [Monoraphidium neglectum]KIY92972.1 hypothetical protein MNEG_14991 [Monoraphidium neglectum]|eukprot:XP_013891992.1 hypothetical protein MNEG_14991 [Monoraphidium neglectum]